MQKDLRQAEYNVTWQEQTYLADLPAAYQAPNRAQNLRAYFTPTGLRLIPRQFVGDQPPWELGLALSAYGYDGEQHAAGAAQLSALGKRLEYQRGALVEWYVNSEQGLEHGFTLSSPPGGAGDDLSLDLSLSGNLTPLLVEAGQAVEFSTPGGVSILRYGALHAADAAGKQLPARLELLTRPFSGLRLHVDLSGASFPITIDPLLTSPSWTAYGGQENAYFGQAVDTAGDVNGDGYADVIVGAPGYTHSQTEEGRANVYLGGASGLSASPGWTAESDQAYAAFGWSVGTAGDVNGDGYADVIVAAPWYDNGQTDEGRAYVYLSGASGLSASPDWTAESDQANDRFGYSVGTAGDVNGDGYADVIVGAPWYINSQTNEGGAFVYYGNGGAGLALHPRARRSNNSAPIAAGGRSYSTSSFRLAALGRTPFGRGNVKLEWEVKPLGVLFNGIPTGQSDAWQDTGTAGVALNRLVADLPGNTAYHWRIRLLYQPAITPWQQYSRWLTQPWNGWNETDLRTSPYLLYLSLISK
jgi:hypothetical protein